MKWSPKILKLSKGKRGVDFSFGGTIVNDPALVLVDLQVFSDLKNTQSFYHFSRSCIQVS